MQNLPKMPISPLSKTSRCLLLLFLYLPALNATTRVIFCNDFRKNFEKFATLYQTCRIEKIFAISPLTKPSIRARLKMRAAKKEIFCYAPSCKPPSASFDFESAAHWYLFIVHLLPAAAPKRGGLVYADVSPCVIALKNSALHTPSGTASCTNGRTSLFASS